MPDWADRAEQADTPLNCYMNLAVGVIIRWFLDMPIWHRNLSEHINRLNGIVANSLAYDKVTKIKYC